MNLHVLSSRSMAMPMTSVMVGECGERQKWFRTAAPPLIIFSDGLESWACPYKILSSHDPQDGPCSDSQYDLGSKNVTPLWRNPPNLSKQVIWRRSHWPDGTPLASE